MPTLYHSASSRGLRPLWVIEEMAIECDLVLLPYPPRVTAPEFLQINPLGTIPFLIDGKTRMAESMAICTYLANRHGPSDLTVSPDEESYGAYLNLIDFGEAALTSALGVRVRFKVSQAELGFQAAGELYGDRFVAALSHIEEILADGRTQLCAGRFTLADISVCYPILLARLTGLGPRIPAAVSDYADRQFARPGYLRAREREKQDTVTSGLTAAAGAR